MWQGIKNVYHLFNAFLANVWFGFPSRHLTVIGVTGTDGKTTTTSLIYYILHTAGYNVSMISSVGAIIGGKNYDVGFHVTTPSPWAMQKFIKKTVSVGSKYLVLETTSHSLDQHRVFGINYDVGVLTNVTHEHLDYHKTYKNYVKTKAKLLKNAKVAIVNRDDESYLLISSKFPADAGSSVSRDIVHSSKLRTYGLSKNSDVNPENFPFKTKMIGKFNEYNALAAISACQVLGIDEKNIRKGLLSFNPPMGREEIVFKEDFTVMIDFAHTPNAFEQILSAVKPSIKGRLIHVFGSAGLRDSTKRPLMGKISAKYSNIIILTAEDPRTESVEKIIEEIASGTQNSKLKTQKYNSKVKIKDYRNAIFKIPDRAEAIEAAIKMAGKGDFVLITGKSHEKSMNYGQGEVPWDEYEVVKEGIKSVIAMTRGDL